MDHVSNLPDEVLCHVLSFLTTKEAALTSVLSKRWRNLLAFVPYLDIDDSVFLHPEEGKRDRPEIIQSFRDFVDRVLTLQGHSPIKKLSLRCVTQLDSDHVDGWISKVLERGVLDLDLRIFLDTDDDDDDDDSDIEEDNNYRLCPNSFVSKTLTNLKIDIGITIGWSAGSVSLPMLKTLVIDSARVHSFDTILHGIPSLDELDLVSVMWQDRDVTISSESLKTLTMCYSEYFGGLSFDTPSLDYFYYSDYVAEDYPVVKMENLSEAAILLLVTENDIKRARAPDNDWLEHDWDNVVLRYNNVGKLINGVRNVQYLDLSANTLEMICLCSESIPMFNNLKSLGIKSDAERGWQGMPILLRNCPNLDSLVIEGLLHHVTDKCGDACVCISREEKGRSLASCPVKIVEIRGFRGTMKEIHLIRHFLDCFPSLEEMVIYVEEKDTTVLSNPEVLDHVAELFALYKELSNCNVRFLVSGYLYEKWTAAQ